MQKNTFVWLAGAAIFAYWLYSKGNAAKNLLVQFSGLSFKKSGGIVPDVLVKLAITNPTSGTLTVDAIAGEIYLNNSQLATFSNLQKFTIPANDSTVYELTVKPNAVAAALTLISAIKKKQKNIVAKFVGTINSTGLNIPINQEYKIA